ncbi:hypothetical protein D3C80_1008690 [compost metagenome]
MPTTVRAMPRKISLRRGKLWRSSSFSTISRNITKGTMARIPETISSPGLTVCHCAACWPASEAACAAATMSAGEEIAATYRPSAITPMTGNSEASVTMPNPDSPEPPLPAAAAMPMPNAKTSGTVTGPVVTAPASQARPITFASSGSLLIYTVSSRTGASDR